MSALWKLKWLAFLTAVIELGAHTASDDLHLSNLSWIAGCWSHDNGRTTETWVETSGNLLFGHAVTMHEGRVIAFEDLRIEMTAQGISYTASPNGNKPVTFYSVIIGANLIVFENPDHDFPQRISYQRNEDTLFASVATLDESKIIEFEMEVCESK